MINYTKERERLGRICENCEKRFVPNGKYQRICLKCYNWIKGKAKLKRIVINLEKFKGSHNPQTHENKLKQVGKRISMHTYLNPQLSTRSKNN